MKMISVLFAFAWVFVTPVTPFSSFGLKEKPRIYRGMAIHSTEDGYRNEIDMIHKYKSVFVNENYNDFIQQLNRHEISKLYIDKTYTQFVVVDNTNIDEKQIFNHFHLVPDLNPMLIKNVVDKTTENNIPLYFLDFQPNPFLNVAHLIQDVVSYILYPIPFFLLFSLVVTVLRSAIGGSGNSFNNRISGTVGSAAGKQKNSGGGGGGFGNWFSQKKETEITLPNVTLEEWAGSPEVIEECKDVIGFLENKDQYKEIGAEMPKGILLEGPPGTGKTLLAKAIATETQSNFISISGSEFIELFVGMGALRVRELFASARENRPSIIFIDEIDAVGGKRGGGRNINTGNDEREQTLNQLLYEMDGFNDNEDILVIAATNRKDILDDALLRPGRFDRIIKIPLPDQDSREKILNLYLQQKKTKGKWNATWIAELTEGYSGAQLKNLINEAAIFSVKNNRTYIEEKYILESLEKSIVGLIKKNASVPLFVKSRVAIHESGHALLALKFNEYFDFQKASIQPTYNGAGGYTIFTEKPEFKNGLYTKDILKKRLIVAMGGKAAESIYYGNDYVSLGSTKDLYQANQLAKKMIENFGMGKKLETFYNEDANQNSFFSNSKYSEYMKYWIDKETMELVNRAYEDAKRILSNDIEEMIEFSERLQKYTVVNYNDIPLKRSNASLSSEMYPV